MCTCCSNETKETTYAGFVGDKFGGSRGVATAAMKGCGSTLARSEDTPATQVTGLPSGSSVKLGNIHRMLAWPLRKDDAHTNREV